MVSILSRLATVLQMRFSRNTVPQPRTRSTKCKPRPKLDKDTLRCTLTPTRKCHKSNKNRPTHTWVQDRLMVEVTR